MGEFGSFILIWVCGSGGFVCGNNKEEVVMLGGNRRGSYEDGFELGVNI